MLPALRARCSHADRTIVSARICSDKTQVEWIKSYINALEELRKYIMQHHTTALAWNPKVSLVSTSRMSALASLTLWWPIRFCS